MKVALVLGFATGVADEGGLKAVSPVNKTEVMASWPIREKFHTPRVWGPAAWMFLHTTALSFPDELTQVQKDAFRQLIEALPHTLPCPFCAAHLDGVIHSDRFGLNIDKQTFDTRYDTAMYVMDIHNEVDRRKGRKTFDLPEVVQVYTELFTPGNHLSVARGMGQVDSSTWLPSWSIPCAGVVVMILSMSILYIVYWKRRTPMSLAKSPYAEAFIQ